MRHAVGRTLVALYPQPFRDRWGQELAGEAEHAGWGGLPRLAVAVATMWLHPAIWPAASTVERRRRVAALMVLITAAGWLTAHAVLELTGAVPRAVAHSWLLVACDLTTFVGFLMAVPMPRMRAASVARLARTAARRLSLPVGVGAVIVYLANHGATPASAFHPALVVAWWLMLLTVAAQAVRTITDVELSDARMPGSRRLTLGLWLAAIGLAGSGLTILAAGSGLRFAGLLGGGTLLLLACAVNGTVRDLAEIRTA